MSKNKQVLNKIKSVVKGLSFVVCGMAILTSCSKGHPTSENPGSVSTTTGLAYNEDEGFQVNQFRGQPEGPNLVFIQGGRTTLGSSEQDLLSSHDNLERTVTVASFYMDETEVANIHWLEYLYYVKLDSSNEFYQSALPDTTVWQAGMSFNDSYLDFHSRRPGFRYCPVVGVSRIQGRQSCTWRTAVVNTRLAEEGGLARCCAEQGGRSPLETGAVSPG